MEPIVRPKIFQIFQALTLKRALPSSDAFLSDNFLQGWEQRRSPARLMGGEPPKFCQKGPKSLILLWYYRVETRHWGGATAPPPAPSNSASAHPPHFTLFSPKSRRLKNLFETGALTP